MLRPSTKDSIKDSGHSHHDHDHKYFKTSKSESGFSLFLQHVSQNKDTKKLCILLIINLVCTFLELIYGFISNSIGLISDAAHMLFDSSALAVGIYASYKATLPPNRKFSFGYERFQTLAGFINGIFLIFIAFYIFIESLERIYDPPVIYSEKMIVVAVIGLIVNLIGVLFFHEHAHFQGLDDEHACAHHHHSHNHNHNHNHNHEHNHHDHDHDHGHHHHHNNHSHSNDTELGVVHSHENGHRHSHSTCDSHSHSENEHSPGHHHHHHHDENEHSHSHAGHDHDHHSHDHGHSHEHQHSNNENLYGVYLHILADLLGSIGVIASSILIMMFGWHITDAICSAITSLLILVSVFPLLKNSTLIFLQTYPNKKKKPFTKALADISRHNDILQCKDPHLWSYTHDQMVCSVVLILRQQTQDIQKILSFAEERLKSIGGIKYINIDFEFEKV